MPPNFKFKELEGLLSDTEKNLTEAKYLLLKFVSWFNSDLNVEDVTQNGTAFANEALCLNRIIEDSEKLLERLNEQTDRGIDE